MLENRPMSKASHIRALLKDEPAMPASRVITLLARKGVNVKASDIYNIRSQMTRERLKSTEKREQVVKHLAGIGEQIHEDLKHQETQPPALNGAVYPQLALLADLTRKLGGKENTKRIIDLLS